MNKHLIMGSTASGKTTKAIEIAAYALSSGKTVLFVNGEERKESIMERIGARMFTLSTNSIKTIRKATLVFDDNCNSTFLRGMGAFDVVIVDLNLTRQRQNYLLYCIEEYHETKQIQRGLGYDRVTIL